MTKACIHVADVYDRMPGILRRADRKDWLDEAPDAEGVFCPPYPDLVSVEHTAELWVRRS